MKKMLAVALGLTATVLTAPSFAAVDAALPSYAKVAGVSGNLSSVGSDTLANLSTLWAEEFKRAYPNINIQIQAAGSSTAPPALTEGTANVGPMSREMKSKEVDAFEAKYGYKPTAIAVAIDALAVYVHKDSPLKGLTMSQVDSIFSSTRKCGSKEEVSKWDQIVSDASLAGKEIQLYGRNSVSGTYGYFKEKALCKGDYKTNVNEQPGSASVVQSVATSTNAIGYSGIGYKTSGVKPVPLSKKEGEAFVEANDANAIAGTYPLARALYVYVNRAPGKPLDPMVKEFMTLVLSKDGQQIVEKDGYVALPAAVAAKELAKLN